jgi:hypothetical protein
VRAVGKVVTAMKAVLAAERRLLDGSLSGCLDADAHAARADILRRLRELKHSPDACVAAPEPTARSASRRTAGATARNLF